MIRRNFLKPHARSGINLALSATSVSRTVVFPPFVRVASAATRPAHDSGRLRRREDPWPQVDAENHGDPLVLLLINARFICDDFYALI